MTPAARDRLEPIAAWWQALAIGLAVDGKRMPLGQLERIARQLLEVLAFLRLVDPRRENWPTDGARLPLAPWFERLRQRWGAACFEPSDGQRPQWADGTIGREAFLRVVESMWAEEVCPEALASPGHWLGQIHQDLLGQRLARTGGVLRAVPSRAARKRSGVFYTPPSLTRYIVAGALGPTLADFRSARRPVGELRVLDPACGCGAFLSEALRQLGPSSAPLPWLCGVDLDPEAVLIGRRALWLQTTPHAAPNRDPQTAAAHLAHTVRCGDVLLGRPLGDAGPFDLILGNPPYRRELHTKHLLDPVGQSELGRRWRAPRMDYWYYFLHRGLELLRPGGRLAFVVGAYWTSGTGAEKLIRELRESAQIEEITLLEDAPLFEGVAGRHLILRLTKAAPSRSTRIRRPPAGTARAAEALLEGRAAWETYNKSPEQLFRAGRIDLEPPADGLLARLAEGTPLGSLGQVRQGIAENPATINRRTNEQHGGRWTVGEGVFALTPEELSRLSLSEEEASLIRPYYDLCDLGRYALAQHPSRHLIYATGRTWPRLEQCPALAAHLARFRPIMEARRETRQGLRGWWQLHWPREEALWERAKILSVQMGPRPAFVPAWEAAYVPFSVNVFLPTAEVREHLDYFAALLNSRLLWKWYQHHAKRRGIGLEINAGVLAQTPIRRIDFRRPEEVRQHDAIVALARELLLGQAALRSEPDAATLGQLREQFQATDQALDRLIYRLYRLSEADIALVERATEDRRGRAS